jgi:Tfp pilus assembly protein PilV
MDPVRSLFNSTNTRTPLRQTGFGLIEAMISSVILIIGLAALAGLFAQSLTFLQYTREDLIAKQKAREALEAVYTARNDGTIG